MRLPPLVRARPRETHSCELSVPSTPGSWEDGSFQHCTTMSIIGPSRMRELRLKDQSDWGVAQHVVPKSDYVTKTPGYFYTNTDSWPTFPFPHIRVRISVGA